MSPSETDNTVVEVWFHIEKDSEGYPHSRELEALLCKPLDLACSTCTIASIPFYVQSVAFGDTVTTINNPSGYLEFLAVTNRSGYSTYRILLRDLSQKDEVIKKLLDFGVMVEHAGSLIAIAVPPATDADPLLDFIIEGKHRGLWGAQDGYIFEGTRD